VRDLANQPANLHAVISDLAAFLMLCAEAAKSDHRRVAVDRAAEVGKSENQALEMPLGCIVPTSTRWPSGKGWFA